MNLNLMPEELKEVYQLRKEGKLHKRLILSISFLVVATLVLFGILFFDIFWQGLNIWKSIGFTLFGFLLTFFFFIKMTKFVWDEKKGTVSLGKFDFSSFIVLAIFIIYRISVNKFLEGQYENAFEIAGFSIATIFGGLLGRLSGTLVAIQRTHKDRK